MRIDWHAKVHSRAVAIALVCCVLWAALAVSVAVLDDWRLTLLLTAVVVCIWIVAWPRWVRYARVGTASEGRCPAD